MSDYGISWIPAKRSLSDIRKDHPKETEAFLSELFAAVPSLAAQISQMAGPHQSAELQKEIEDTATRVANAVLLARLSHPMTKAFVEKYSP